MMGKPKIVAAISAGMLVVGCSSPLAAPDHNTPTVTATTAGHATPSPHPAGKPRPVRCLRDNFTLDHPRPRIWRVSRSGWRWGGETTNLAVVRRHQTPARARRSAAQGRADGVDETAFGRFEVIFYAAAADPRSGERALIVACVTP
jgi:hypothetical protein